MNTEEDPRAYAAELIGRNRARIARAVARQIRQMVPRYQEIDTEAHERNAELILSLLEGTLTGGSDEDLLKVLADIMRLRSAAGFQTADFVMASHCFMPVIRRFVFEKSQDLRLAHEAFTDVEEHMLAILQRMTNAAFEVAGVDETAPNQAVRTVSDAPWMAPITVEPV